METFWGRLFLYSGMISTSVMVGGVLPVFLQWTRDQLHRLLSFSAGLMLGATLIHLLPASFELIGKDASIWVLAGFLLLFIFEKFLTVHICELLECEVHSMGIAAVIGISAHALSDGVALGSGLLVSEVGFVVFLTIFFHKLPEAIALTTILMHEKQAKARIIFFNLLLIAMVPLGALLVHLMMASSGLNVARISGIALAFSAGTFLHISLTDLLPHAHEHAQNPSHIFLPFLGGLAAMMILELVVHHHGVGI